MKTALLLVLAAGVGFATGWVIIAKRDAVRHGVAMAGQQAAFNSEKAALEEALDAARARRPSIPAPTPTPSAPVPARPTPAEIIAKLQTLKGPGPRTLGEAVYWLTELAQNGPSALPAIREFLASNQDLDWDTASFTQGRTPREVPLDFALPPSLRFGLFDVVRQIGGPDAEQILAESLSRTGRGVEVAYLARVLQEIAPNHYKDQALTVARDLLASSAPLSSTSPLDRGHRDYLYGVLAMYNDGSFAATAQAQLVQADGQIGTRAFQTPPKRNRSPASPSTLQALTNRPMNSTTGRLTIPS
jgi:hypothetical protein